jgi:hypothetical protein
MRGQTDFNEDGDKFFYTDVDNQSTEFQATLKQLLKYGILSPRPVFDGDAPLTWEEYVRLYVWMIYHRRLTDSIIPWDPKSPTFETILKKMPIDMKAYVDTNQKDTFDILFKMYLAGVNNLDFTEKSLDQFQIQKDTRYHLEWKKIEDFEYLYFLGEKMSPNGSSYFNTGYYNPQVRVSPTILFLGFPLEPVLSDRAYSILSLCSVGDAAKKHSKNKFSARKHLLSIFLVDAFSSRQEYLWWAMSYEVSSPKEHAINHLVQSIDFRSLGWGSREEKSSYR